MRRLFHILLIILVTFASLLAQGRPYEGPDDPAGDIAAIREGWMNGNRVYLYFQNTTELSYCCGIYYSRWPNDFNGLPMTDGIGLLIGARVYVKDDSIPVDDPTEIATNSDLVPVYFLQTSYRERMDVSKDGTVPWGFYPVFGYFNDHSEHPAMSNRPDSWPTQGWPSRSNQLKWPGEWNGRFGRGVMYADLETYFVANDAQDQEYLQTGRKVKYYPRPGIYIGDKKPDVTIQKGAPWGGLGIRVAQRGYQWSNLQTRDAIFWEYDITNISDYDINEVAFGYWVDNGIGGNSPTDDIAFFDKKLDMCYSWDIDGIGEGGLKTGIMGLAYLESPGLPYDGVDNDEDGLIDEKRDNQAVARIGPTDGIADLQKFMDAYGFSSVDQLREHWDADEDQDWRDGKDENGNGRYDAFEDAGDDVGLDGVGPADLNYTGPDPDGSEGNHRPDFLEGVGCEPNFAATDVSESDMVGLTSFTLFKIDHGAFTWFEFDRHMFNLMAKQSLDVYIGEVSNLVEIFASGLFPLKQGRTERISMAELHAYEELSGLNAPNHSAPSLFEKKRIVQFIYESDYRFAQPPLTPSLTAIPGDGKVILVWDEIADRFTREPLLKGVNDFEGYKIYKATDKYFADAEVLRDMYGNPIGKKPIFQCDLKDGRRGAADFAHINGEIFYLGEDTGIRHTFVDEDVQNGRTYYYAVVAYDYGYQGREVAIMPSENNVVIDLDENENIRFTGKNVAVVTPGKMAAGYVPPNIEIVQQAEMGSGQVIPEVVDLNAVQDGHTYRVTFDVQQVGHLNSSSGRRHPLDRIISNRGLQVYDETLDSLVYKETHQYYPMENIKGDGKYQWNGWNYYYYYKTGEWLTSDVFAGLQLKLYFPTELGSYDSENSGWVVGQSPITVKPANYPGAYAFPYVYDIIWTDNDTAYAGAPADIRSYMYDTDGKLPWSYRVRRELLFEQPFNFYVVCRNFPDSSGNYPRLDMVVYDINANGQYDKDEDEVLVGWVYKKTGGILGDRLYWGGTVLAISFAGVEESQMPKAGDVYRVSYYRPFFESDTIRFVVKARQEVDEGRLKSAMENIKVVPNPYVATNTMETAISNAFLNQRRKLMFSNVPSDCIIKIFTASGVVVDQIEVHNAPENGMVHWDMLTREGLEIAPGIYLYHIKSLKTGQEKMGKFAVVK